MIVKIKYRIPIMNAAFWLVKREVLKMIYTSDESDIHLEPRFRIKILDKPFFEDFKLKSSFTSSTAAKLFIVYSSNHEIKE